MEDQNPELLNALLSPHMLAGLEESKRDLTEANDEIFQGRYGATKREYKAVVAVIEAMVEASDALAEGKLLAVHRAKLEEDVVKDEPSLALKTEQLIREYSSLMDTVLMCSFLDYIEGK